MNKYLVIILGLLTVSCASNKTNYTDPDEIVDKWELVTLDGKEIHSEQSIYLEFSNDNMVSGYSGCNQINAAYRVLHGTQIEFENIASTRILCEDEQMDVEREFLDMLENTNNYTLTGDKMSFSTGKRAPHATFRRMMDNNILGKYWKLTELEGNKIDMVSNQDREQFLTLKSNGTFYGFAGCNTFNGKFRFQEGNYIVFEDDIAVTMKACPDIEVNETEYLKVISQAHKYDIDMDKLFLMDDDDNVLARFSAVYF